MISEKITSPFRYVCRRNYAMVNVFMTDGGVQYWNIKPVPRGTVNILV